MNEIEVWKSLDFLNYPDYEISNFGNVKSLNYNRTGEEKIMKQSKNRGGYMRVGLYKNGVSKGFSVHKLVALAFIPNDNPIEKTEINHLDENKENNHVSNLCWCSHIENINYGTRNERAGKNSSKSLKGHIPPNRKPIVQCALNGVFIRYWNSITQPSQELNISLQNIHACCRKKRKSAGGYKWVYKSDYKPTNTQLELKF